MFKPRRKTQEQKEFWVMTERLPKASPNRFYELLNGTLEGKDFANQVRELCVPAYADAARGGRPGIDPVVYFKMLMVGFFEGLESERQIAARCADCRRPPAPPCGQCCAQAISLRSVRFRCAAFSAMRWMRRRRIIPACR
jgi:hypothetical protein